MGQGSSHPTNKVIRHGKVAVLYSPGFGSGWSTWMLNTQTIFHPKIVDLVESGENDKITEKLMEDLFGEPLYAGGAESLEICWLPEGTEFCITEYDGNENVVLKNEFEGEWLRA